MINVKWKYLKLSRKFFDDPREIILESMPGGMGFMGVVLYLKILCEAVNHEAYLNMGNGSKYTPETICIKYRIPIKTGVKTLSKMVELALIEWVPNSPKTEHSGDLFVPMAMSMVGKDSDAAQYWREHRKEKQPEGEIDGSSLYDEEADKEPQTSKQCLPSAHQVLTECSPSATSPLNPHKNKEPIGKSDYVAVSVEQKSSTEETSTSSSPTPLARGAKKADEDDERNCVKDSSLDGKEKARMAGEFFAAYPQPKRKYYGQVLHWFFFKSAGESEFKKIMSALEAAKQTDDWAKDEGRYIPLPGKWLDDMRWLDARPGTEPKEGRPKSESETVHDEDSGSEKTISDDEVDIALANFYSPGAFEIAEKEFPGKEKISLKLKLIALSKEEPTSEKIADALACGATEEQIAVARKIRREEFRNER